ILPLAREAQVEHPELRAVIKADTAVTHGRVIHVLDLLKQAHVNKIAFGVSPLPAAAGAPSAAPAR
ncbi:MAG: ExbD/TolR family protein, partial [Polyangiaceae bacterium]